MDSRCSTSDMSVTMAPRCRPLLCHVIRDHHVTRIASKVVISKSATSVKRWRALIRAALARALNRRVVYFIFNNSCGRRVPRVAGWSYR